MSKKNISPEWLKPVESGFMVLGSKGVYYFDGKDVWRVDATPAEIEKKKGGRKGLLNSYGRSPLTGSE